MCVIAGYIGNEQAAPVLLEMLRREEAIGGGYYTGIATIHDGKLHYEKTVGDVAALLEKTDAKNLPGTIGIAHSRTKSGGGREWGHPFIDTHQRMAYIANGAVGAFDNLPLLVELSEKLMAEGHLFRSAQQNPVGKYPRLSDGQSVHFSDTFCQAISAAYDKSDNDADALLTAASRIYQDYPNSIVGMCLHANHPDEIVVVRHDKPCEIGRDSDGDIYLASTTIAFPREIDWQMRVPPQAGISVRRDGSIQIQPFEKKTLPLGKFPASDAIWGAMEPLLSSENPPNFADLCAAVKPLWADGTLDEKAIAVYEMLAPLLQQKRIRFENVPVPGVEENTTVPQTRISLN